MTFQSFLVVSFREGKTRRGGELEMGFVYLEYMYNVYLKYVYSSYLCVRTIYLWVLARVILSRVCERDIYGSIFVPCFLDLGFLRRTPVGGI